MEPNLTSLHWSSKSYSNFIIDTTEDYEILQVDELTEQTQSQESRKGQI